MKESLVTTRIIKPAMSYKEARAEARRMNPIARKVEQIALKKGVAVLLKK